MVRLHQFPQPTEGIHFTQDNIVAVVDSKELGTGMIFVTEGNISWINGTSGEGFSILYPKMTLHAISKDESIHPKPCLYVMLNGYLDEDGAKEAEVEPDSDADEAAMDDEEGVITEVRFVPEDPASIDPMYKAVQECTILHPDPCSDMSDEAEEEGDDDDDDGEEDEDDDGFGRLMSRFGINHPCPPQEQYDPDQFADAE